MLRKNCVLVIAFLYGVLCQDTNPEWLEPNTTSTIPPVTTTLHTTTTVNVQTTTPNQPTDRIPATTDPTTGYPSTKYPTRYPTTRYPTTIYPTTRYPTTKYPTRYPPMPSPTPSRPKPPQEICTISLSKPAVQYYSFFGMTFKSIVQCCNLCCSTKLGYQPYCRKIPMKYCVLNANKYNSYDEYDY